MSDEEYMKARMQVEADKNCMYHTDFKGTFIALCCIILVILGAYVAYNIGG